MKKTFRYVLRGAGPRGQTPYIELPFDSVALFGTKARVPVKVTINGVEMRAALAPMGGKHVLGFRRELAEKAKIAVGDAVRVTIEKDDAPRIVEVPPALAKALATNKKAKAAWDALSYTHQREHAEAIRDAKQAETRARRIEKTMAMLTTSGKPKRPEPSSKPLASRLHIKPGMKTVVLSPPKTFSLGLPTAGPSTKDPDVVLLFVEDRAALAARFAKVKRLADKAALWIAYPKTTSGMKTDLTRDAGWDPVKRAGLTPVTQVAVDETWSALRFRPRGANRE